MDKTSFVDVLLGVITRSKTQKVEGFKRKRNIIVTRSQFRYSLVNYPSLHFIKRGRSFLGRAHT